MENKPHSRYEHVYPVVRIDYFHLDFSNEEEKVEKVTEDIFQGVVTVTKVFLDETEAECEAQRLNELRRQKEAKGGFGKSRYYVQIARLVPQTDDSDEST